MSRGQRHVGHRLRPPDVGTIGMVEAGFRARDGRDGIEQRIG